MRLLTVIMLHWKETFKQQYADVIVHYNKTVLGLDLDAHLGASYEGYDTQVDGYRGNLTNVNNFTQSNIAAPTAIFHPLWGKEAILLSLQWLK